MIKLICNAKVFDGSSTNIYVDTAYNLREVDELVGGVPTDVWDQYTFVDGTFTTTDYTAPTISITTPTDGSTVSRTVNVAATITDVGGVDADSIEVCIGGVEVTPTLVPLVNGYTVTAQRENVPAGNNVQVQVCAEDLTGNSAAKDHYVTVAEAGITFAFPANGTYTNEAQPTILANFVKVDCTTIKMFVNDVDVTASCAWTGAGPDGTIALNYSLYGALADGAYHVVVNGTNSLVPGQVESDEVYFVKDTVAPIVSITGIDDSDGDGFPEAGELLCVDYTAIDANLDDVWFGGVHNISRQSSGCIDLTIATGNKEMVACASDLAGNIGYSAPVHIYNNNLVYFNDSSLGSFAGLDLTKTALYDVFSTAKAFTLTGPNKWVTVPTLGELNKTITAGSNVTLDNRKNNPIPAGSLPPSIGIYTTPTGTLDFAVTVPNVTNATLMIARANSTLIDQLIKNPSKDALTPGMLEDLLDSETIVLYGHSKDMTKYGYKIAGIGAGGSLVDKGGAGTIQFSTDMPTAIRNNYVDLSTGFDTRTKLSDVAPLSINKLGQGEYALLAVCMDDDRFAIIAGTAFTVTKEADLLSTSAGTYTIGQPVVVNSAKSGEVLSAVVLNSAVTYTGNVTLNFSTLGKDTFRSAYLFANGNQTVVKPFGQANVWLTKGYGNASAKKNAASVSVPTFDLLPGTYRVYMFLEDKGNVTSYNEATITLTTVTPPTPGPAPYYRGGGGGGSGSTTASYTGTGTLLTGSSGTVLKSIIVNANDNIGSVLVPIGTKALDADGKPLGEVALKPLAGDAVPAVPSGSVFKFAGYAYEASPDGATFSPGITLSLSIPEDVWNSLDLTNQQCVMKWYNKETGLWEDVPTTVIPGTRTVEIRVTHFSIYALFTEPVTTPTPTETASTTPTTTTTTPSAEPPAEGLPMMMILAIFAVIAIIIAAGYFLMMRK
ncbi:Ig-like domain-containing protein [Methanoculleus sp. 10]|uniref:Ig-like domain-containing protein n=1 Tax=Methanoculleus sp. 10 TaxID=430615 RepID=UPI0025D9145B|nr:Ig-like domain-containing protein [Methanoculleus sp. 10]